MRIILDLGSRKIEIEGLDCQIKSRQSKKDSRYVYGLIVLPHVMLHVSAIKCEVVYEKVS